MKRLYRALSSAVAFSALMISSQTVFAQPSWNFTPSGPTNKCPDITTNPSNTQVGIGTSDPAAKLHVVDDNSCGGAVLFEGSQGGTPASGAGSRFMWIPDHSAIRGGEVTGAEWDNANIGSHSVAFGKNTIASGNFSFASGDSSQALGAYSTAIGFKSKADFSYATAIGWEALADGLSATALGFFTHAGGGASVALGSNSVATGSVTTAIGGNVTASGTQSLVFGLNSNTTGVHSFAYGRYVTAAGEDSYVIGKGASSGSQLTNSIDNSLIIGVNTTAPTVFVGPGVTTSRPGRVGIGTTTPQNAIDIEGSAVIGGAYSGTNTAPANGLLVQGNVGIATTANPGTFQLFVNGTGFITSGMWSASDARFKTNIETIQSPMDKVLQLRGVLYDYRRADFADMNFPAARQMGFIAQELERVAPEAVRTNNDGYKAVRYENLTALLVEAVKEQHEQSTVRDAERARMQSVIDELRNDNRQLRERLHTIEERFESLFARIEQAERSVSAESGSSAGERYGSEAIVLRNVPNPFSGITWIEYSVPGSAQNIELTLVDAVSGVETRRIRLDTASGRIALNANELHAGAYFYSLISDGKILARQKMILAK